jgi:hypothetical protein
MPYGSANAPVAKQQGRQELPNGFARELWRHETVGTWEIGKHQMFSGFSNEKDGEERGFQSSTNYL